jgi:hypothetical protein
LFLGSCGGGGSASAVVDVCVATHYECSGMSPEEVRMPS